MRKSKVGKTVKGINVIIISLDIFLSDVSKGTVFLVYDMVHVIILSFRVFYQHCFLSFVVNLLKDPL